MDQNVLEALQFGCAVILPAFLVLAVGMLSSSSRSSRKRGK